MALLILTCLLLPAWRGSSCLTRPPTGNAARLRMMSPGSSLPLPPTLDSLEGVPGRFSSLEELSHGRDLLVLVASSESSMSDRLRQTLVGLQELAPQHGVQFAAVTMVGAPTYRKLARKTSVSYPLLSDPSRAWLGLMGGGAPAPGGEVVLYVVAVPTATVLARFGDEGGVPQLLEAVGAAVGRGRAALETEAATRVQGASKAAEVRWWAAWRGSCPGALALRPALAGSRRPHAPPLSPLCRPARAGGARRWRRCRPRTSGSGESWRRRRARVSPRRERRPVLTRTPRGLRTVRAGCACQPRVLYVPEAQGSLPRGATHCTYRVCVPASGVPFVPRTVWCITGGGAGGGAPVRRGGGGGSQRAAGGAAGGGKGAEGGGGARARAEARGGGGSEAQGSDAEGCGARGGAAAQWG